MRVALDFETGNVALHFDGHDIDLRRPTLGEWCAWQEAYDRALRRQHDLIGDATLDPVAVDEAALSGHTVDLNLRMMASLMLWFPFDGVGEEHPLWLALSDRTLTAELLTFWRDYPISPWTNAADAAEVAAGDVDESKLIRSTLPGALGARAVLYKALPSVHPGALDRMELWQIAALLGRDTPTGQAGGDAAPGEWAVEGLDDGGRITRANGRETRSWRRKPGAPFLFSTPPAAARR